VIRRLLNIASIVCLVLCVALMGMWVRSYYRCDELRGRITNTRVFSVDSMKGQLYVLETPIYLDNSPDTASDVWPWSVNSRTYDQEIVFTRPFAGPRVLHFKTRWGFDGDLSWTSSTGTLPYWFLVLASGSLAMAFRLKWPLRFTLRGLFLVTTFLAVVLGLIAWLDRAWIGK
jgi:hypothetical protein